MLGTRGMHIMRTHAAREHAYAYTLFPNVVVRQSLFQVHYRRTL